MSDACDARNDKRCNGPGVRTVEGLLACIRYRDPARHYAAYPGTGCQHRAALRSACSLVVPLPRLPVAHAGLLAGMDGQGDSDVASRRVCKVGRPRWTDIMNDELIWD